MITEMCPHCEEEVEIKQTISKQNCPKCGKPILPCSMCDMEETECQKCMGGK